MHRPTHENNSYRCRTVVVLVTLIVSACTPVAPWQRGTLAKASMALEPNPMQSTFREHTHGSREAASGSSAASGGGCGCY